MHELLLSDDRVLAVWLGGSFGRGTADALSDLDLFCIIQDDQFDHWLDDRPALYRRLGVPLLIGPDQESMVTAGGRSQSILLRGLLSVDLEGYPERNAMRMPDTRVLFERHRVPVWHPPSRGTDQRRQELERHLGFFWAMVPIANKYIMRGATHRAVTQIDLLTQAFVALWRLTNDQERVGVNGAHWLHPEGDARLIRHLPRPGSVIGPLACYDAVRGLMGEVVKLHETLRTAGVVIPVEAVRDIMAFADAVGTELRSASNDQPF